MKSEVSSTQSAYVTNIFADESLVGIGSWARMMLGTVGILCVECVYYNNILFATYKLTHIQTTQNIVIDACITDRTNQRVQWLQCWSRCQT